MKRKINRIVLLLIAVLVSACGAASNDDYEINNNPSGEIIQIENIPEFDGENPYIVLNDNIPSFTDEEKTNTEVFEVYTDLDSLGRCGVAFANLHISNMPTEKREGIGQVKPTGWVTSKYDFVDGKYLYNRCHLIGFQLAGENANEKNLITGTRYMNVDGMLPFENMVADYLKETGNHVLYRVTPIFSGDELVARAVVMEAYSVEDNGEGIQFNVYCYNNQPGVIIDYTTGENELSNTSINENTEGEIEVEQTYVINTNTGKFHSDDCDNAGKIAEKNKKIQTTTKSQLLNEGYEASKCCIN